MKKKEIAEKLIVQFQKQGFKDRQIAEIFQFGIKSIGTLTPLFNKELENILKKIAYHTGIPVVLIKSRTSKIEVADARFIYFTYAENFTDLSLATIANYVGKSHAMVLHGKKQTEFVIKKEYDAFVRFMNNKKTTNI